MEKSWGKSHWTSLLHTLQIILSGCTCNNQAYHFQAQKILPRLWSLGFWPGITLILLHPTELALMNLLFKYLFRGNEINFMSNLIPIAQSHGLKVRIFTYLDPVYLISRFIHTHFEMKINICFMITGLIQVLNMITFMILELMVISQILGEKSHILSL